MQKTKSLKLMAQLISALTISLMLVVSGCKTTSVASSTNSSPSSSSSSSSSSSTASSPRSPSSSSSSSPSSSASPSAASNSTSTSAGSAAQNLPSSTNQTSGTEQANANSPAQPNRAGSSPANGSTGKTASEAIENRSASNTTSGASSNDSQYSTTASSGSASNPSDDPFADLNSSTNTVMTNAERRAALDARLENSYAEFDGLILTEREVAQGNTQQRAGSNGGSGSGEAGSSGGNETFGQDNGSTVIASSPQTTNGGGFIPNTGQNREGEYSFEPEENFPIPEDIPSGNNDDVVARQLREAAMKEPDPELREALWDEYRVYTGI